MNITIHNTVLQLEMLKSAQNVCYTAENSPQQIQLLLLLSDICKKQNSAHVLHDLWKELNYIFVTILKTNISSRNKWWLSATNRVGKLKKYEGKNSVIVGLVTWCDLIARKTLNTPALSFKWW